MKKQSSPRPKLVVQVKGKPRRVSGRKLGLPGTLEVSITTRGGHKQVEIVGMAIPTAELAEALRELHDFASIDTHYRRESRSMAAFAAAADLLKRLGC